MPSFEKVILVVNALLEFVRIVKGRANGSTIAQKVLFVARLDGLWMNTSVICS